MQNQVIVAIAPALESATPEILAANDDCQAAAADGIPKPLYNRLKLINAQGCDRRSET